MLKVIYDKLDDNWFRDNSEDEDDLEGILDFLKPDSYEGFTNSDTEVYIDRRCKLLGITYTEPSPIIVEKVEVIRYTLGHGEAYTEVRILGVEEMPRTNENVTGMRAKMMEKASNKT